MVRETHVKVDALERDVEVVRVADGDVHVEVDLQSGILGDLHLAAIRGWNDTIDHNIRGTDELHW
jgi:hypothetical protein